MMSCLKVILLGVVSNVQNVYSYLPRVHLGQVNSQAAEDQIPLPKPGYKGIHGDWNRAKWPVDQDFGPDTARGTEKSKDPEGKARWWEEGKQWAWDDIRRGKRKWSDVEKETYAEKEELSDDDPGKPRKRRHSIMRTFKEAWKTGKSGGEERKVAEKRGINATKDVRKEFIKSIERSIETGWIAATKAKIRFQKEKQAAKEAAEAMARRARGGISFEDAVAKIKCIGLFTRSSPKVTSVPVVVLICLLLSINVALATLRSGRGAPTAGEVPLLRATCT